MPSTHFLETLNGRATIRAFKWVGSYQAKAHHLLDDSQRPLHLLAMLQHWLSFVLQATVAVLAVAIVTLATQLRTAAGFTGVGLVALMSFADMLAGLVRLYTELEIATGALSRLKMLSEAVPNEAAGDATGGGRKWNCNGELILDNVSAVYT